MTWILLSLLSALFLGVYDVLKKSAVKDNAVPPVLLFSVLTAAAIWLPWMLLSHLQPNWLPAAALRVDSLDWHAHGLLLLKSILVGCSWTLAFFALKHLPISIASPIRATSPMWTVLIAVLVLGERLSLNQGVGVLVILTAFFAFSRVGRLEGIHFHRDRWVGLMVAATLLGSISALYDKYLLHTVQLSAATVQAWFSIYLVPVMLPLGIRWRLRDRRSKPFQWRWSIPLIACTLLTADFLYFTAIGYPDALISVISPVRRSSIIISYLAGILLLGEHSWRAKGLCIAAIILGVCIASWS